MTQPSVGFGALDPDAVIVDGQPGSLRFAVAAADHARQCAASARVQVDQVAAKRDEVVAAWDAKVVEAQAIERRAGADLVAAETHLTELEG